MINSIGNSANTFFSWYLKKRMNEIKKFIQYPKEIQNQTLLELITIGKSTLFGEEKSFHSISTIENFKSQIRLRKYKDFEPYINKQKAGKVNVLWPGKVKWFAQSSGTTSGTVKHIPITIDSLRKCHYKGGKDLLALYYHNNPNTKLFTGKHLIIGGSSSQIITTNDQKVGDLSAIIMENLPWWCEWRRSPKKVKSLIKKNWEDKINYIVNHSSKDDIHIIAGTPSWVLIIIHEILRKNNISSIHEVWPNLELYLHGGLSIEPYKESFQSISQKNIKYYQNYNATEGFFGLQYNNSDKDMLLMLDYGIYYEFIKKEDWFKSQPKTLSLEEVELNEPYEIVVTTNGGLWRYRLEDTIIFTSLNPFKIKVTGRTQQFINIAGEEVMIQHVEKAIEETSKICNCSIAEFSLSPKFEKNNKSIGYHYWIIEFLQKPDSIDEFNDILDNELQKINVDYKAKRAFNSPLKKLIVKEVRKNTFYKWLKSQNKLGGQSKIPRINNDDKCLNEILQIAHII